MKKSELYTKTNELLAQFEAQFKSKKSFEEFKSQIDELLKPKSGGGVVQYPMIVDNDINYHFCRYSNYYLPESEIVMSKGKSKGYSKKAIALWTKIGRTAQELNNEAMKLLLSGDVEAGKSKAEEAEKLKVDRNKTSMYDEVRSAYEEIKLDNEVK